MLGEALAALNKGRVVKLVTEYVVSIPQKSRVLGVTVLMVILLTCKAFD